MMLWATECRIPDLGFPSQLGTTPKPPGPTGLNKLRGFLEGFCRVYTIPSKGSLWFTELRRGRAHCLEMLKA